MNIQEKISALISTISHYSRLMYDNIYAPNFKFGANEYKNKEIQ